MATCCPCLSGAAGSRISPQEAAEAVPAVRKKDKFKMLGREPPDRVLPWLYIGDYGASVDYRSLKEAGIGVVLNVRKESIAKNPPAPYNKVIRVKYIPIDDLGTSNLRPLVRKCIAIIDKTRRSKTAPCTLVHCAQGVNRSSTVVLSYLMLSSATGWSLFEAWNHLKPRRTQVRPNPKYWAQLEQMEVDKHHLDAPTLNIEQSGILNKKQLIGSGRKRSRKRRSKKESRTRVPAASDSAVASARTVLETADSNVSMSFHGAVGSDAAGFGGDRMDSIRQMHARLAELKARRGSQTTALAHDSNDLLRPLAGGKSRSWDSFFHGNDQRDDQGRKGAAADAEDDDDDDDNGGSGVDDDEYDASSGSESDGGSSSSSDDGGALTLGVGHLDNNFGPAQSMRLLGNPLPGGKSRSFSNLEVPRKMRV